MLVIENLELNKIRLNRELDVPWSLYYQKINISKSTATKGVYRLDEKLLKKDLIFKQELIGELYQKYKDLDSYEGILIKLNNKIIIIIIIIIIIYIYLPIRRISSK
jgi:hypothetical protein